MINESSKPLEIFELCRHVYLLEYGPRRKSNLKYTILLGLFETCLIRYYNEKTVADWHILWSKEWQ